MLSAEQRSSFSERGFLRVPGAFGAEEAGAMERLLWESLGSLHGVRRDDPKTWRLPAAVGLQPLRGHETFAPIGGPALAAALDELLGPWEKPSHWGQFLVSFPAGDRSAHPPPVWHTDFPFGAPGARPLGALVFSFLGAVPAGCGGTLVVAGSHRVVGRFLEQNPRFRKAKMKDTRRALLDSAPWLRALSAEWGTAPWQGRFMAPGGWVGEVPVEVAELRGDAGDVVIGHPWLLHGSGANVGERPRFMRVQRIRAAAAGGPGAGTGPAPGSG